MIARRLESVLAACALALCGASTALADGIIIPDPPPWPDPPPLRNTWLTILYHRVNVSIRDRVAITHVEQEFLNEHDWDAEGTYVFPLPDDAVVSNFVMWVDGEPIEGRILEADEARAIYEETVRRRRDPALLEYVGRDAVQARVFPIPPGAARKIELEYTQLLPVDAGLVRYVYPLSTEKFSARQLDEISVRVEIESQDEMRSLYSPTHQDRVAVVRDDDHYAVLSYEETKILPEDDFEVVYTVGEGDLGVNLLTYVDQSTSTVARTETSGFFVLLVAPTVEIESDRVIPRDVILVLDTSGSMEGEKIDQAKEALSYVLAHLNERDRFNVIAFSTGLKRYSAHLQAVTRATQASEWVQALDAVGGTDINRAILEAMATATGERPTVIILLTDGQPTEGITNIQQILANAADEVKGATQVFGFGVGDDVDTELLDALTQQHGGTTGYVRPHEQIDEEVSSFFDKIGAPVLANLDIDYGDLLIEDTYPYPVPDLFAGTQLVVTGRYRGGGSTEITVSGDLNGRQKSYRYDVVFPDTLDPGSVNDPHSSFIPRLWAARKIGYLMTQTRLQGEKHEWTDAVVDLSLRYGIITPYTSFLIEEDDILSAENRQRAEEEFLALPQLPSVGAAAVEQADAEAKLRGADSSPPPNEAGRAERRIKTASGKTFVLQRGVWTDTAFDQNEMRVLQIGFGSADYFELLSSNLEYGSYLALGERLLFADEGIGYEITPGDASGIAPLPTGTPAPPESPTPTAPLSTHVSGVEAADPAPPRFPCFGSLLPALATAALAVFSRRARG
jgi:Ca-activated chloride channel family protein